MQKQGDYSNHLAGETSPYLLQHAANPVAWYPWNRDALALAAREQRPILLSIGYSACHWCHVMAHESFEDPATAELMNRLFVNIKVDREERPDLDRIYQSAHSLLTGRPGGWPLTVFLTPDDQVPFFAGTYFPDQPRHGLLSFRDLLVRISEHFQSNPDEIRAQNRALLDALADMTRDSNAATLSAAPLDGARQQMERSFDAVDGGFGEAPKFPHPTGIERLLRHWARSTHGSGTPDRRALHMAVHTLEHMARGGIVDQLGGGFCRYSVDRHWMIPHFEKMLCDNGLLLALYAEAAAATGSALFRRTCSATAGWVMREMQADSGGYYASLDADSEGAEGRFYTWTRDTARAQLDADGYALFARRFGLDRTANFEGRWHLYIACTYAELADEFGIPQTQVEASIAQSLQTLSTVRAQRVRPGRDDKILTAWNGLMIRGMAVAGRLLGEPDWIASAERALGFVRAELWRDGRLLATAKDGKAHLNAYLDDYVFLLDALLELLQARWHGPDLAFAIELADVVLAQFSDPAGGFFFTSADHEQLIQRPKPLHDDAIPSGNGVAARALNRLGHLLGESRYLQAAESTLRAAWSDISSMPQAHAGLLVALEDMLYPPRTVIIRGDDDAQLADWQSLVSSMYAPGRQVYAIPAAATGLPGNLAARRGNDAITAWICEGNTCGTPITERAVLHQRLIGDNRNTE